MISIQNSISLQDNYMVTNDSFASLSDCIGAPQMILQNTIGARH